MLGKFSTGTLNPERRESQNNRYWEGHKYDFIIIGSGMAALTFAANAAHAGYKVCILEAHDVPGGYAHSFKYGEFSFCAQVHYIWGCGPGGHVYEFLKNIGLEEEITFELLGDKTTGYDRMVMPDGKKVFIPYGYDKLVENIERAYPGQGKNVKKFTDILSRIRNEVKILPDKIHWSEYFNLLKLWQFRTLWKYQNKTLQNVFDECHLSREAQAVLIAQAGDFMAPPNELSIFAYTGLFGGYNTGAYYPTKHFNHFIDRIVKFITDHEGCHIYYETRVKDIDTRGNIVYGISTQDKKFFTADRYICNMDPQAASYMIGREKFPKEFTDKLDYEYSHTGLMIYLGLKNIDLRDHGFGNFNTWHLEDWDMNETWRQELAGDYSKPWIFMGTPTLHSDQSGIAPNGCHILEVETLGGYDHFKRLKDSGDNFKSYNQEKSRVANIMLDIVEKKYIPNLREHIALKLIGSPTTNEDFCLAPRGNAYGSHLTPKNMGLGRLKSETPFRNLWWCNASSGYGGICPTIGTGNALYMKLIGDKFYNPADEPTDEILIQLANRKNHLTTENLIVNQMEG